jgi:hypothetical protein
MILTIANLPRALGTELNDAVIVDVVRLAQEKASRAWAAPGIVGKRLLATLVNHLEATGGRTACR